MTYYRLLNDKHGFKSGRGDAFTDWCYDVRTLRNGIFHSTDLNDAYAYLEFLHRGSTLHHYHVEEYSS